MTEIHITDDHRQALQERDCPSPVGDLYPGIDIEAGRAVAGAEAPVIMDQNDES